MASMQSCQPQEVDPTHYQLVRSYYDLPMNMWIYLYGANLTLVLISLVSQIVISLPVLIP